MPKVTVISTTGRLASNDYKRPKETITQSVQNKEDIEKYLEDYVEITQEEMCTIPLNSHLRYIRYDKQNNKELFRFGGLLIVIKDQYVILSGKNAKTFSVQRYTYDNNGDVIHKTRFFKKRNEKEKLESKLEETIKYSNEVFAKQKLALEEQQKEIERLTKLLKKKGIN